MCETYSYVKWICQDIWDMHNKMDLLVKADDINGKNYQITLLLCEKSTLLHQSKH